MAVCVKSFNSAGIFNDAYINIECHNIKLQDYINTFIVVFDQIIIPV